MGKGFLAGVLSADHAGDFLDSAPGVERLNAQLNLLALLFVDLKMAVAESSDLGQVGNAQNLA